MSDPFTEAALWDVTPRAPMDECIPIDTGYRVRETDEYVIEVWRMLFNWRVVVYLAGQNLVLERGYCYFGTGADTLVIAIEAAKQWEDPLHTDPIGFQKRAF